MFRRALHILAIIVVVNVFTVGGKQHKPNYNVIMKDILKIVAHIPLDDKSRGNMPSDFPKFPKIPNPMLSSPGEDGTDAAAAVEEGAGDGAAGEVTEGAEEGMDDPGDYEDEDSGGFIYYLFTNETQLQDDTKFTKKKFGLMNNTNPTKIVLHGWTENAQTTWYAKMFEAYFKKGQYNIIAVDWSALSTESYLTAFYGVRDAGQAIGKFISSIIEAYPEIPMENYHIIGHSMGAHVGSFVAKAIYSITGNKIGRVTALDPAGPMFDMPFVESTDRLNADDAIFVDAIHTDGLFGFKEKLAMADFYPNAGASMQPGCTLDNFANFIEDLFCSHHRSCKFFIESINTDKMVGQECDSANTFELGLCSEYDKIIFGENCPTNASGNFYFYTNAETPYAKDEDADNTVDEEMSDLSPTGTGMPDPNGMPGVSGIPGVPDVSSIPGASSVPGMNSLPGGVPDMNSLPGAGNIPGGIPDMSSIPGAGSLPDANSIPSMGK